jgi:hypothetical protein
LNQERYRLDQNRRVKGKVVNSIVTQIQKAGGRFLERSRHCEHLWYPVFPSVARQKVSHALRDKCATNPLSNAISELKARILDQSLLFLQREDDIFDEISSIILNATLPQMEHASDQLVTTILAFEVEKFLEMSIAPTWLCSSVNLDVEKGRVETDGTLLKVPSNENNGKEVQNQVVSFDIARIVSTSDNCEIQGKMTSDDQSSKNQIQCKKGDGFLNFNKRGRSKHLDDSFYPLIDSSSKDSSCTTSTEMWDLPENFTANDCEELVASLDHLSSMFE